MWAILSDISPDFQKSIPEGWLSPFACLAFPFATKLIYSAAAGGGDSLLIREPVFSGFHPELRTKGSTGPASLLV